MTPAEDVADAATRGLPAPHELYRTANGDTGCELPEPDAQALVAEWCRLNGAAPPAAWPVSIDAAVAMLTADGYAASAEVLEWLASLGQVPPAPAWGWWTAKEFVCGVRCLEARRAWLPGTRHDLKKSGERRALDRLILAGDDGKKILARTLRGLDLHYLLVLLAECDNRTMREALLTKVQGKLFVLCATDQPAEGDEWKTA
jgi:hypothetical protein